MGPNSRTNPVDANAQNHAWELLCPPKALRTIPKPIGPRKEPMKPMLEWTAIVTPRFSFGALSITPVVIEADSPVTKHP